MSPVAPRWHKFWTGMRTLLGDDAYERYLAHCRARHPDCTPLDRGAFYVAELDRRWRQVNRCC
ncbi:MAG: YbdD/YjiX family protein [Gammaproteobacteria bacterium]|nr:YbdD/YjiX family protein [Gammaproteobacteria bacterium]